MSELFYLVILLSEFMFIFDCNVVFESVLIVIVFLDEVGVVCYGNMLFRNILLIF